MTTAPQTSSPSPEGLRTVTATRYVTPLREGGSLPAIVEADDLGTYVLKFRGAGQGRKTLVAEVVAGELARFLGLNVPEIVYAELDGDLARAEPDPEIQDLIRASGGLNVALDYLPGSLGFDPLVSPPGPGLASHIVWFDALVQNVDRSPRNTNLLVWHGDLWLIDHGAALYFHHNWPGLGGPGLASASQRPYVAAREHVLLPFASALREADEALAPVLTQDVLRAVVGLVPDEWLAGEPGFEGVDSVRGAYVEYLSARLKGPRTWVGALEEARGGRVKELFEYAVLRVVPRVERGEFVNAGVVLHCGSKGFLDARVHLDPARLAALDPGADPKALLAHLEVARLVCAGGPAAGYVGGMPRSMRFGWLTAPRSAAIQPSPVHTGFSEDPEAALEHLLRVMVLPPG